MYEQMIKNLINYIIFIEKEYNLNISFHELNDYLQPFLNTIGKYGTHSHPFCMYVKSHRLLWDKCLLQQKRVLKNCGNEIFYGMCYCGVEEYIVPIQIKGKTEGFICATGYCQNERKSRKRIQNICTMYGYDFDEFIQMQSKLNGEPPKIELIQSALSIAADMLSLVCMVNYKSFGDNISSDYIYANIAAYLENNYRSNITVSKIASFCHCSKSYINHIFKKKSGVSISQYVNQLRINSAKSLLKTTKRPINEIAFSLGFNDSNYFTNLFKLHTGYSPKNYRNLYCE